MIISISTGYIQRLDISTLRKYIRKLEESEARLEEAQRIARLGTWEYSLETDTLIWSKQFYHNTGIPVGTPLTLKQFNEEMLPEEDRIKLNEAIQTALTQTGTFDVEHRMYNVKKEILWIMAKGKVIYDNRGRPIKILGTARDFTQEKLSDLLIEQQNKELQAREEELRQNLEELQATQEQMRLYQQNLEEKNKQMAELNEKLEDLVEQRTHELLIAKEAAEAAQKQAEQANKVKSDFLSNMSHELRTPLNGILGYAQILINDTSLSDKHKEKLQIINKSGEHLLGLINDILDLSKIEAGKMELHYTQADLHALIQEIYDLFKLRCENKGLQLIVQKDPELPKYIRADVGKLRQCIINFMGNAVKFTQKGSITFITHKEFNGNIYFAVKDTGRGIPKDKINEMTKPFTQIHHAQNTEGGTGLGLAITKSYVELMGGIMHIESELGVGSTFSFSLPLEIIHEPVQIVSTSTQKVVGIQNGVSPKILIVDDSEINVEVANELLQSVGFTTEKAYNGKEAIEKYQSFTPDLILMDIRMPIMDGFEATKEIRKIAHNTVKIIAVTADAFEHQKNQIFESGLDGYIAKPYTITQLLECIAQNLPIEYIYETENTPSNAQETHFNINELDFTAIQTHIPHTWVAEMEKTLLTGNMEQISVIIQSLNTQNNTVNQVKKYLLEQVENFNDLAIEDFLKRCKSAT